MAQRGGVRGASNGASGRAGEDFTSQDREANRSASKTSPEGPSRLRAVAGSDLEPRRTTGFNYRRIVLAYDGSVEGRAALREGVLLAARCEAELHLLCVVSLTGSFANTLSGSDQAHTLYVEVLDKAVARLAGLGFRARGSILYGEPTTTIASYVNQIGADLLVVGHKRQNLISRWWGGSSGAYLCDNIACSLLIARGDLTEEAIATELGELGRPPLEPLERL